MTAADIQAAACRDPAAVENRNVGGAAADVQIDHSRTVVAGILLRAAALPGEHCFEVGACGGNHKVGGQFPL